MSATLKWPEAPRSLSLSKGRFGRARRATIDDDSVRTVISDSERRRPGTRFGMRVVHVFLFVSLVIAGLGPILWLAKSAVTPTQDTLTQPFALWPNGIDWANLSAAWNDIHIDQYFFNTVVIAAGAWVFQLLIAPTGAYTLSILRPRYAWLLNSLVLATLIIPGVVLAPGMPVETYLLGERRSALDYVFRPITDSLRRSLRD